MEAAAIVEAAAAREEEKLVSMLSLGSVRQAESTSAPVLRVLVAGGHGFIGGHLVERLKRDGAWVRVADIQAEPQHPARADDVMIGDLRDQRFAKRVVRGIDYVYQLAADMGGAGYIFTGDNDASLMYGSAMINLNLLRYGCESGAERFFFSSSACVYPARNQQDPTAPNCVESSVYPAEPDSEYGWEKLFAERLFGTFARNCGVAVRIARLHNVFGPYGCWYGGREKAPAAICRKVAEAQDGSAIEVWGDGRQTRSFLYVDECVHGIRLIMDADHPAPINLGSTEMVTIDDLVLMVSRIAGKHVTIRHVDGPTGVRGRTSENGLLHAVTAWAPSMKLEDGLRLTYGWIKREHDRAASVGRPA